MWDCAVDDVAWGMFMNVVLILRLGMIVSESQG